MMQMRLPDAQGLYRPENEHDNCGIGFVAHIKGKPSHDIVKRGLFGKNWQGKSLLKNRFCLNPLKIFQNIFHQKYRDFS